jgi:hypothetical protein
VNAYGLLLVLFLTLSVVLIILVWRSKSEQIRSVSLIFFMITVVFGVLMFVGLWGYGKFKEIQAKNPDPPVTTVPPSVAPNIAQNISGLVRIDGTTTPLDGVKLKISLDGKDLFAISDDKGSYRFSDLKGEKNQSVRIYIEKEGFKLPNGGKNVPTNLGKTDVPIYLTEVGK